MSSRKDISLSFPKRMTGTYPTTSREGELESDMPALLRMTRVKVVLEEDVKVPVNKEPLLRLIEQELNSFLRDRLLLGDVFASAVRKVIDKGDLDIDLALHFDVVGPQEGNLVEGVTRIGSVVVLWVGVR